MRWATEEEVCIPWDKVCEIESIFLKIVYCCVVLSKEIKNKKEIEQLYKKLEINPMLIHAML